MKLKLHCFHAIRPVLRGLDPDSQHDCYQDFWLQKLLNPQFIAAREFIPEDKQVAWEAACATNFARTWRRKWLRDHARNRELDDSLACDDKRRDLEDEIVRRHLRGYTLEMLRAHAGEILDVLATCGRGKDWAAERIRAARSRGLSDLQTLIAVYAASLGCAPRGETGPGARGRGDVYAARTRERLVCLQPYLRGERPWPAARCLLKNVMLADQRAL